MVPFLNFMEMRISYRRYRKETVMKNAKMRTGIILGVIVLLVKI